MRTEAIKNVLLRLLIFLLIAASCLFYLSNRQKEQEALDNKRYEGIQVFLEGTEISALYDDGTKLWVGTKDGILLLDRESGQQIQKIGDDLEMIYASGIVQTDDQTVWAGHNSGLTGFLPDQSRIEFREPEIPAGRVNTLLAQGDCLWGGTMQGAFRLVKEDGTWSVEEILTEKNGLACNPVNVICQTDDFLFCGAYLNHTPGGISIRSKEGSWQYLSIEEGLAHPYINAFWPLSDTKMLAASGQLSAGGLCVLEQKEEMWIVSDLFSVEDGIPGEKVRWLFVDRDDHLWITTESNGLLLCPDTQAIASHPLNGIVLTEDNGLSDNEIKCIAEIETVYWLGGRYGLTRIDRNTVSNLLSALEIRSDAHNASRTDGCGAGR